MAMRAFTKPALSHERISETFLRGEPIMKNFARPARHFALTFTSLVISALVTLTIIAALAACGGRRVNGAPIAATKGKKTMQSFGSDEELKAYLRKLAEERRREAGRGNGQPLNSPGPATTASEATGLAQA